MKISKAEPLNWHYCVDENIGLVDSIFIKRGQYRSGFNKRMFEDDFTMLFRSINQRDDDLFDITVSDDELLKKILGNVKLGYGSYSLGETIKELVEEISRSLFHSGKALYFLHDDTENENIYIISFSTLGVVRFFATYMQWVPKCRRSHLSRNEEESSREIRIFDSSKVMRFEMPRVTKQMLSKQDGLLATLDKYKYSEVNLLPEEFGGNRNSGNDFDFHVWKNTTERAFYRATRNSGWNGRIYDSSKRSDFFDCHRLIRFRRNQILFRDHILKQLSGELSRVGKAYNIDFSVVISGSDKLTQITEMNDLEKKLVREEVGFNEVIDFCYRG